MVKSEPERHMLSLAGEHLKAAQEGDWDRWEALAAERARIYREWEAMGNRMPPFSRSVFQEVTAIDRSIVAILEKEKRGVLAGLAEVRQARRAMAGYQGIEGKGTGRRRLKITC